MRIKAACDTETTNVNMLQADAVEVSIVPLNDDFTVNENIKPFTLLINPGIVALELGKEALAFNKIGRDDILANGLPAEQFTTFLEGWMYANGITSIQAVGHNWEYDRVVLKRLMGHKDNERIFYRRSMDSHKLALAVNDRYELAGKSRPFNFTSLSFLAGYFGMDNEGAHRAEFDCIMTAGVYRKLLQFPVPSFSKEK